MNKKLNYIFGTEISKPTAVSIGAFDGLHLGHCHILNNTIAFAKKNGLMPAAVLFDPLPSQFFGRLGKNERILLREEQETMLYDMGIEHIVFLPFSDEIANLTPCEFISAMQAVLHCKRLTMGEDFSLGKDRAGTPDVLTKLGEEFGYSTEIIKKDVMDGDIISSTRIRSLLHAGKVPEANRLLGYNFFFSGEIIHGDARGRRLGIPTINVKIPDGKLELPKGVYAVYNHINGKKYASVTNIGVRPTFGLEDKGIFVESYLLNSGGDFYGKNSRLEFIEMLREEKRFNSAEELKAQISRDIQKAEKILVQNMAAQHR
jgi:riboflavin kinase/FMN adenylyltransferase